MSTDIARLHAVFDLAMRIGEGMLSNGAAASEVTSTVLRVTSAAGLRSVAVQVTFDEVSISYLPDDRSTPFTRIRAAGHRAQDFARLTAFEEVTEGYVAGDIPLEEARARVAAIPLEKPHYPFLLVAAGFAVMGGGAALSFGTDLVVILFATLAAGLLTVVVDRLSRLRLPLFYGQAAGALVGMLVAAVVSFVHPGVNSSVVTVACIIVLLAGLTSIGAMQDAITGWYVTASARILETIMLTVGVVIGVRAGMVLTDLMGADLSVTTAMPVTLTSALMVLVSGAVMGLGFGVATYVPLRLLGWGAAGAAASSVISHGIVGLGIDRVWSVAAASLVVGVISVILARRLRAPALLFVMAGVVPLVPGSRIYRGLQGLGSDVVEGSVELMSAAGIAIAIAGGAVLGQLLASRLLRPRTRSAVSFTPVIAAPFTTLRRRRLSMVPRRRRLRTAPEISVEPSTMTGEMTSLPPEIADALEADLDPPEHAVRTTPAPGQGWEPRPPGRRPEDGTAEASGPSADQPPQHR
ncbi:threonine/serine ThrE exporter family protein [Brachybacterium hainanense]|uniref:Threonine/serine exporter ThrE family protein n=1 Tax=Brachybacterium hainanense TaxID=1541174 RepID=A0ABV6RHE3_9MICO